MLKLYKIPLKAKPLQYLKENLLNINSGDTLVLVPTNRNLRTLASMHNWELDIQTVSEFTKRANNYKGVVLPKELRQHYLFEAVNTLSHSDTELLLKHNNEETLNYINFIKKSPAILPFYRELSAEQINPELLKKESLYQDYEAQVDILIELWENYRTVLHKNGYIDEWEHYFSPSIDPFYIDRYTNFIFLISGYLTNYEILQLKNIAETKNVEIFFNFIEETHPQYEKLVKAFGSDFISDENDCPPLWYAVNTPQDLVKCIDGKSVGIIYQDSNNIYTKAISFPHEIRKGLKFTEILPCVSAIAQFDLINRRISEEHFNNGTPFHRMAVILPSSRMVPWFTHSDSFLLYNVSAGHSLDLFPFFQQLQLLNAVFINTENGEIQLKDLQKLVASAYFQDTDYNKLITDMLSNGTLSVSENTLKEISWGKLYELAEPFFQEFLSYHDIITSIIFIVNKMLKELITSGSWTKQKELESEGMKKALEELEKFQFLYGTIEHKLPVADGMAMVLQEIGKLAVPVVKGVVPVIGLLESRNMQFDYIFIPDLNDDVFPAVQQKDFFLNSEVRVKLDLPTVKDREELQKSYLYQIISRAKQSIITYTASENMRPSSVVNELLSMSGALVLDKEKDYQKIQLYNPEYLITVPVPEYTSTNTSVSGVKKNSEILNFLKNFTYSATSLDMYRKCPLKFYYRYVMKLKEDDIPVEDADMRLLGEKLHKLMEYLFKNNISAMSSGYLDEMYKIFDRLLSPYDYFTKNAVGIFQAEALKKRFPVLAAQERERIAGGAEILGFELNKSIIFSGIKIQGKIDRLDKTPCGYSIIDYKYKKLDLTAFKNFEQEELQLPLYALMTTDEFGTIPHEILWFDLKERKGFVEGFPVDLLTEFSMYLENFIQNEILGGTEFTTAKDPAVCNYCAYKTFCAEALV